MNTALAFPDDDESNKSRDVDGLIKDFQNKLDHFNRLTVPFDQTTNLQQWLDNRYATRTCGVLIGDSGVGKTKACKLYTNSKQINKASSIKQAANNPSNSPAIYIRAHYEFSQKALFESIVDACNLQAPSSKLPHIQHRAISSLKTKKTQLIILDQAELLPRQSIRFIPDLIEQIEVPIVLSGGYQIEQLVRTNGFLNKHFSCHYSFSPLNFEEMNHFIQVWEYEFGLIKPLQASNVKLLEMASNGNLRMLIQILAELTFLAIQEKVDTINKPFLKKVLKQFR